MELFDYVTNNDGIFVPNLWYDKPEAIKIQFKTELIKCIEEIEIVFYVISPRFQIEPLMFCRFEKDDEKCDAKSCNCAMQGFQTEQEPLTYERHANKKGQHEGKYYIQQRRGGPYIDLSFYRGYADDAPIKFKCTRISHYPSHTHYDDFELYERFPLSKELKTYYGLIGKFLKSKCRQVTATNGKKYWVSKTLTEENVVRIDDTVDTSVSGHNSYNVIQACKLKSTIQNNSGTFTDPRDGKTYRTVKIGEQVWLAENLAYEYGKNKCYDNDPENCRKYGRLYYWEDAVNAVPSGWHLPSKEEWTAFTGGESTLGIVLKAASGWACGGNGVDVYGFSALPGGHGWYDGSFIGIGEYACWWTASEYESSCAYYLIMYNGREGAHFNGTFKTRCLHSVRCVKDCS